MSNTEHTEHHDHGALPAEVIQSEKIWWAILPVILSAVIGGVILFSVLTSAPAGQKEAGHSSKYGEASDHGDKHAAKEGHSEPHAKAAIAEESGPMGSFRIFHATNTIEISGVGPQAPVYDELLAAAKTNFPNKPQTASWIGNDERALPFGDQIAALTALLTQPETGIEFDGTKFRVTWPEGETRDAVYEKIKAIVGDKYAIQWATAPISN